MNTKAVAAMKLPQLFSILQCVSFRKTKIKDTRKSNVLYTGAGNGT